ncbi:sigma-E processing peptidase SpoIIGA [Mesobacillus subterraneus]|uniref:Sigma-E processing peptidase SpoIIGA n=1 Tax=Mesobacillus subterraneus TaxID=285983 RepID=A0A427TUU4_9BACI|nr:sigma-E processing peptidase SpoIIGA [Mesobacillus subterraneus]RSD28103.1 sigma-E processing peptidase SpoIIGA [Mesobacillus subterraneus]
MKVYLDVIWALNLLFDTFLLYLTAIILKRQVKLWRLALGGAIGSMLIILSITPLHAAAGHPVGKLFFSILMVLAAFGYNRFRFFVKSLMTFYVTTFLLGGTLTGVHYFIQFDMDLASNVALNYIKGFGDPVSWLFVLLGFPLAWHFSKRNIEQFEMTKIQYDSLAGVEVQFMGMVYEVKGLIDSGNQLYDPISKMPVMIFSIAGELERLPVEIRRIAENPDCVLSGEGNFTQQLENRMRIIPCKVVGQEHQLIIAFNPEKITITAEDGVYVAEKGLISFTAQQLSADGSFQCIIHPKMMTGMAKSDSTVKVS